MTNGCHTAIAPSTLTNKSRHKITFVKRHKHSKQDLNSAKHTDGNRICW